MGHRAELASRDFVALELFGSETIAKLLECDACFPAQPVDVDPVVVHGLESIYRERLPGIAQGPDSILLSPGGIHQRCVHGEEVAGSRKVSYVACNGAGSETKLLQCLCYLGTVAPTFARSPVVVTIMKCIPGHDEAVVLVIKYLQFCQVYPPDQGEQSDQPPVRY